MVLQHTSGAEGAAVYGLAASEHAKITVAVKGPGVSYTVDAVTTGNTANGTAWRATLRPAAASHDEHTISASCAGCAADSAIVLERVVFGDVYFCSGQSVSCLDPPPPPSPTLHPCLVPSNHMDPQAPPPGLPPPGCRPQAATPRLRPLCAQNMALSLHFTFSKPALEAAVLAGQYSNIRTFQYGGMSVNSETFHADAPKFATADGAAPWYNVTYGASISSPSKGGHAQLNPFEQFSATCTYFAVGLVDLGKSTPIGLIQSSVGGMQIEAYLDNETLTTCKNESGYKWNASEPGQNVGYPITSKLWYGMVTPFVNTSLAGWVWCESRLPLSPLSPSFLCAAGAS